jgi:hypothetical protein
MMAAPEALIKAETPQQLTEPFERNVGIRGTSQDPKEESVRLAHRDYHRHPGSILQRLMCIWSATERIKVFVARSRHKNFVELNRRSNPYGILRQAAPLGKHIREMVGGVPVIHGGGKRGEEADTGGDLEAAGRGGSGLPAIVCGKRAHGW